jgi:hypothetical protein
MWEIHKSRFHACTSATRGPAASQSQSASAVCCKEGAPPRGSIFTKLPNEANRRKALSTKKLSVRAASNSACGADGYSPHGNPRKSQDYKQRFMTITSQPASTQRKAMQFCRSKRQQAGLQSPPGFPAIICYCRDRAVRASVLFLASPHFTDASCMRRPVFPCIYR